MRITNGVLCALLILFAVVQYNDPDGVFWIGVYGAGAAWCGLAAVRSDLLANVGVKAVFGLTLAAAIAGVVWFWPTTPEWWKQDVWWTTETAREGMGMMIVVVCLLFAGAVILPARRS